MCNSWHTHRVAKRRWGRTQACHCAQSQQAACRAYHPGNTARNSHTTREQQHTHLQLRSHALVLLLVHRVVALHQLLRALLPALLRVWGGRAVPEVGWCWGRLVEDWFAAGGPQQTALWSAALPPHVPDLSGRSTAQHSRTLLCCMSHPTSSPPLPPHQHPTCNHPPTPLPAPGPP